MIGETVGSYKVVDKIGEGGMGAVFLAEHTTIGRRAALKMLLPEHSRDPTIVGRFFNEARATSMIEHPGLITVFDFGHHVDGAAYIVMEFLQGESLGKRLRDRGSLPPELLVPICRQIASALAAAHAAGIIHRDLKPDNVFLVPDREVAIGLRVKVLDFGIAKLMGDARTTKMQHTSTGAVMGTPLYMSPEQCRGAGEVDARSDVYSLGCIMFEASTGRPPFLGTGAGDILAAHLRDTPSRPSLLKRDLPPAIETLIMKTLAKEPDQRQQSMRELEAELDALGDRLSQSLAASMQPPVRSPARVAGILLAALVVLAGALGAYLKWGRHTGGHAAAAAAIDAGLPLPVATAPVVTPLAPGDAGVAVVARPPDAAVAIASPTDAAVAVASPADAAVVRPATPAQVRLSLSSEPSGAAVLQGGKRVGRTPFTRSVDHASGKLTLVVHCGGYADAEVVLSPAGAKQRVALKRLPGTPFGVDCE